MRSKGIESANRARLDKLHRLSGPFDVREAAETLEMDVLKARRFLAYLTERGWLTRVNRGLYAAVPLGAGESDGWREDPWVVAVRLFSPCYIGGWTACEHWDLTEQIFRDIVVITAANVRKKKVTVQETAFELRHLPTDKHFGLRNEWLGRTKVPVSDPTRTMVDVLDQPRLGGGIRHVAEMLRTYFESEHRNEKLLLEYGSRLGNRTVFKRLGYLLETLELGYQETVEACRHAQSSGLSPLDPSVREKGRILKRWNIRVNVPLGDRG